MRFTYISFLPTLGVLLGPSSGVTGLALPTLSSYTEGINDTHPFANLNIPNEPEVLVRADKVPLRILPLGASIVHGVGSSEGDGFRRPLRNVLRHQGFEVNMVGSKTGGVMIDWENEGTPGDHINDAKRNFQNSASYKANVVVINVGTNDANTDDDISGAGDRMKSLLNSIWSSPGMANTCIMLSTLLPTLTERGPVNQPILNAQYRQAVIDLKAQGKCIYLADMDPASGPAKNWIRPNIIDTIHPNDEGHEKMAYVFWQAIIKAHNDGAIKPAAEMDGGTTGVCEKVFGSGTSAGALTQQGSGIGDGIYYHESQNMGIVLSVTSTRPDADQWRFARLYGRQYDDFLGWFEKDENTHAFGVWKNFGNGQFTKIADLDPDLFCIPRGIHFIDMNADGLDDLVCIDGNGNAYLSINQGDGTDTRPPTFKRVSSTALIKTNEGYSQERVRLADIDGDGRGDYCILDDGGNVHCWRNGWVDDIPKYWQSLGLRFHALGKGDIRGVRFEDINGDGRDDWIWVSEYSEVETHTNARSCRKGRDGDGLNVAWRQGFLKGQSSGYTHLGLESFTGGEYTRNRTFFGRIFGQPQDFGLLGSQDYIFLDHSESDGSHKYDMRVWKNIGHGGTKLEADGNKYCNMVGHANGAMDYVWTLSKGEMRIYPNKGLTHVNEGESFWGPNEIIWDPVKLINKQLHRRDLHLMDWDGDGTCDIVWVNPDNANRPSVWINHYPTTQDWGASDTWEYYADPPSARGVDVHCNEKRGLGIHDLAVRFGDLTGNGRDDYLCLEKDGRVTGYVHEEDNSWTYVGQVKFSQEKDRANLRWVDLNGDGRDDMVWIDKFTGDGTVWYNGGYGNPSEEGGSSFHWDYRPDPVIAGNHAGTCIYLPDLDGNGIADLHSIIGTFNNQAETWFSPSCDRQGDDPECCSTDPELPEQPVSNGGGGDGCVAGHGPGDFNGLCMFACQYGFCPKPCVCDETGTPGPTPSVSQSIGYPAYDKGIEYAELCAWACSRGECPSEACIAKLGGVFSPTPIESGTPNYVETGCEVFPYALDGACNAYSLPESFDPRALRQDCSSPVDAVYPWQCPCNTCPSTSLTSPERWARVFSQDCLSDLSAWYSLALDSGELGVSQRSMPWAISRNWGGIGSSKDPCGYKAPQGLYCDIIGNAGCKTVECGTTSYAALDLVLDSMYNFWTLHDKMYTAFEDSESNLADKSDAIVKTFIKEPPKSGLEIIQDSLSAFGQIFSLAGSDVFSGFLSDGLFDGLSQIGMYAGYVQDSVNTIVDSYQYIGIEQATQQEQKMQDAEDLAESIGIYFETARFTIDAFMKYLYGGSDFGRATLLSVFSNGAFLQDPSALISRYDFSKLVSESTTSKLVESSWRFKGRQHPVVLFEKAGATNPMQADYPIYYGSYMPQSTADKTLLSSNFKASDGGTYAVWLVALVDAAGGGHDYLFEELTGQEEIESTPNEWGITWKDMAESAFNGYVLNERENPFPRASIDQLSFDGPESGNFFTLQRGISTPGYTSIPVCYDSLAFANFGLEISDRCPEYPCCELTETAPTSPCRGRNSKCEPEGL